MAIIQHNVHGAKSAAFPLVGSCTSHKTGNDLSIGNTWDFVTIGCYKKACGTWNLGLFWIYLYIYIYIVSSSILAQPCIENGPYFTCIVMWQACYTQCHMTCHVYAEQVNGEISYLDLTLESFLSTFYDIMILSHFAIIDPMKDNRTSVSYYKLPSNRSMACQPSMKQMPTSFMISCNSYRIPCNRYLTISITLPVVWDK